MNVMVEHLDSIQPLERREFQFRNEALDMLLFDLLQELIYHKDSEKLMLRIRQIQIKNEDGRYTLKAVALGEKLDPNRHTTRADVKAVTLHRFNLVKTDQGWKTQIILDI
jgi:SHS2 domain-containing protein